MGAQRGRGENRHPLRPLTGSAEPAAPNTGLEKPRGATPGPGAARPLLLHLGKKDAREPSAARPPLAGPDPPSPRPRGPPGPRDPSAPALRPRPRDPSLCPLRIRPTAPRPRGLSHPPCRSARSPAGAPEPPSAGQQQRARRQRQQQQQQRGRHSARQLRARTRTGQPLRRAVPDRRARLPSCRRQDPKAFACNGRRRLSLRHAGRAGAREKAPRLPCSATSARRARASRRAPPVSGRVSASTTWTSVSASAPAVSRSPAGRRTLDTATCTPWYCGWGRRQGCPRDFALGPAGSRRHGRMVAGCAESDRVHEAEWGPGVPAGRGPGRGRRGAAGRRWGAAPLPGRLAAAAPGTAPGQRWARGSATRWLLRREGPAPSGKLRPRASHGS